MKVLIIFTSLLAVTLAGGYQQHYPINIPVIGKTGVPLESAEIVHARHAHLSHVAAVKSHQGEYYDNAGYGYAGNAIHSGNAGYAGVGGYATTGAYYPQQHYPINIPIIGKTGVPLESAEIVHARQAHLSQVAAVRSHQGGYYRNVGYAGIGKYAGVGLDYSGGHYGGAYALPVIGHGGVPIDTPEVQAARAAHFAAHAKASVGGLYGGSHYRKRRSFSGLGGLYGGISAGYGGYNGAYLGGNYGSYEAHTYPKLGHDGQPIETPAVQALKHKHFAAHAEALSRVGNGYNSYGYGGAELYGNQHLGAYGAASYGHGQYHGPIHIPIIGHNGVPIDTPEVQHARQQHYAALAKASSHSYGGHGQDGHYY